MENLKKIQMYYQIPVQSHLSENPGEIAWVKELCPVSYTHLDVYKRQLLSAGRTEDRDSGTLTKRRLENAKRCVCPSVDA